MKTKNNLQKKAYMIAIIAVCSILSFGCKNESRGYEEHVLNGTAWKLVSMVGRESANNPTGAFQELRPVDCEDCYTLWFDTGYTASGIIIGSRFKLDLRNLNPYINMDEMMRCEVYDKDGEIYCDFDFFYRAILTTGSWSATDDELKLFQHHRGLNGEDIITTHLLFKRIDCAPVTLRGTQWHLEGIVDTQTGGITRLEPINALDHVIKFCGDYTIQIRSLNSNPLKLWIMVLDNGSVVWRSFEDDLYSQIFEESLWLEIEELYTGVNRLFQFGKIFAKSYELTQDELKLFFVYQEKNYYLLYKLKYP